MSYDAAKGRLPFSANPLQPFTSYRKARFAAKGGAVVALGFAITLLWSIVVILAVGLPGFPREGPAVVFLVILYLLWAVGMAVLAWRIWRSPGPIKNGVVAGVCALNLINFSIIGAAISLAGLSFSILAVRGALAMRKLARPEELGGEVQSRQ